MSDGMESTAEHMAPPLMSNATDLAMKQGYLAAFFPDTTHKKNPYLGTGEPDKAWAWLEGFQMGTNYVLLQNENLRLKIEVSNLKAMIPNLPDAPPNASRNTW